MKGGIKIAVTIRDVAKRARVSISTVSRALNNSGPVKKETKRRVLKVAKEINYTPNAIARGLVTRKTGNIGFILPTSVKDGTSNPFYSRVFETPYYDVGVWTVFKDTLAYAIPKDDKEFTIF